MRDDSSATAPAARPISGEPGAGAAGPLWGLIGVLAFSFTVPLTRVAVGDLPPDFVGAARAVVAAGLAAFALALTGQRPPRGTQWLRVALVGAGVVVGFPLLTSVALTTVPAHHGALVIALLPAATAVVAAVRGRERPARAFWWWSVAGTVATLVVAGGASGDDLDLSWADLLLLGAVLCAAVGYAEGGLLARELGAWQTVSWALVVCLPLTLPVSLLRLSEVAGATVGPMAWAAFAYLAVVSMYLGFFAWYRGLGIGPMAQVSQVQLVQPVLSIAWSVLLLGESVGWLTVVGGLVVATCAGLAVRSRLGSLTP